MPFCPQCKYEYQTGVSTCPDCKKLLVDRLPDESDEEDPVFDDNDFVTLPDLPGKVYAEMIKGALEKKGITCYIHSQGLMEAAGVTGTGLPLHASRLYVPKDRYDECLEIQQQMLDHI
jgi:hypothetical protein